jgi:hypothetical protein
LDNNIKRSLFTVIWLNATDPVSEKSISVVEANVDKKLTALMNVNDREVRFQLDSAADVNLMLLKQVYLEIFLVVVCSLASYFSVVYFHVSLY